VANVSLEKGVTPHLLEVSCTTKVEDKTITQGSTQLKCYNQCCIDLEGEIVVYNIGMYIGMK